MEIFRRRLLREETSFFSQSEQQRLGNEYMRLNTVDKIEYNEVS